MEEYRSIKRAKWYGSVRILRDNSLRLSPWTLPNHLVLSVWDTGDLLTIWYGLLGEVLYLYLWRRRVGSACFHYQLSAETLRRAVDLLRTVRGGLESWIVPALEWNQADAAFRDQNPKAYRIIPELLDLCRDLPVAESWQRRRLQTQRNWADHLREHPEDFTKVIAPWMLPEGFTLSEPSKNARKAAKTTRRPSRK